MKLCKTKFLEPEIVAGISEKAFSTLCWANIINLRTIYYRNCVFLNRILYNFCKKPIYVYFCVILISVLYLGREIKNRERET